MLAWITRLVAVPFFFYELDAPLPYYPLKSHIPAFRLESVQIYPFISWQGLIPTLPRIGWGMRVGPVFSFHGGDHSTVATARTVPDGVPFELFRLGVYRQPMDIPYLRTQVQLTYRISLQTRWRVGIHPFMQLDLGDLSRVWYRVVPQDPKHSAERWLHTGMGSWGLSCTVNRIR